MQLALTEARRGIGHTHPNPAVGAVIVKRGQLLATGWHRSAGQPHAEIEAILALRSPRDARGATIFITLEPCSTEGRTPPCTSALMAAGFRRVVYGARDPNPKHSGAADAILQAAGIEFESGVLAEECAAINTSWNKWIATGMPFVIAKAGMSLDGRISPFPGRRWITSPAARADAMRLRSTCDAVLVGGETVRQDNPKLTVRGVRLRREQPWRAVWSRSGDIPSDCKILTDRQRDRTRGYENTPLRRLLADLGKLGVQRVLIEGGGRLLGEAFDRHLVDEIVFYTAPTLLGGPVACVSGLGVSSNESAIRLERPVYTLVGGDIRVEASVKPASSSGS